MNVLQRIASKVSKVRSLHRERNKSRGRSPGWDAARDAHLLREPVCVACGGDSLLQVHHVAPFHLHPELELDPTNLITLCMGEYDCHLRIGHGDSFRCYNPQVRDDAAAFRAGDVGGRLLLLREAKENRRK